MTEVMTNDYLEEHINGKKLSNGKKGPFTWTGPTSEVMYVRKHLMNHWLKCAGKPATEETVYNMSKDPLCVDERFLTLDPDSWKPPKKKVKV